MTKPIEHESYGPAREGAAAPLVRFALSGVAVPLALALLPFLLFLPLTLVRETFYVHDVQHYFYAYHAVSANMLRSGTLPLWNPYAFSGIPLIGDGQTAMFYPPNWLFFMLPGAAALNYAVLLQFSIAGVGMYLCALGFGLRRLPALVAALAFMFCGFMTARVVHLSIMSGVALVPLLVLCVDRALGVGYGGEDGPSDGLPRWNRTSWFVAAALVAAMQVFAGHPQVPVYIAAGVGMLALIRGAEAWAASGRWLPLLTMPLRLAGIYVLGYALAAVQLVPWVELGAASPRAAGASYQFVMGSAGYGADWLLFLFPYVHGALRTGMFADTRMTIQEAVRSWEHSAYVGMPTLALAIAGIGSFVELTRHVFDADKGRTMRAAVPPAERHRWFTLLFLVLMLVIGVLTGAGKYTPFSYLVYATPVVGKLRAVERALVLAAFALPLLAGFGMQWLGGPRRNRRAVALTALGGAGFFALATLFWVWFAGQRSAGAFLGIRPADLEHIALSRAGGVLPLLLALATLALLALWVFRPGNRAAPVLLAGLLLADMAIYATSYNPTTNADLYDYQPQVLQALDGDGQPFRKATVLLNDNNLPNRVAQETLAVSWAMVYGVEDMNGFNSLQPRRYTDYVFGAQEDDVSYGYLNDERLFQPESPILSSLNVRYLLVPVGGLQPLLGPHLRPVYENAQVKVYENTRAWPRAYFAERVRGETDPREVLRAVTAPGFDGRNEALVESATPPQLPEARGAASVRVTHETPNRIELAAETAEPRLLVLSEMYFPGWHAYVDGAEVPIERTNYLFRGVVVPAGQHTVTFVYRPLSVVIGLVVSALAALVAVALVVRRRLIR